eukprot:s1631_g5.t1
MRWLPAEVSDHGISPAADATAEDEVASDPASRALQRRQRRAAQQERRKAIRNRLFQEAILGTELNIHGLRSKEFEVDLLLGERLCGGEPIRVKLTKTISLCRRLLMNIFTCGLYELWFRCCAYGSRVFDVDARIAVTTMGRLLLWTHTAGGGGLPLSQHCCRAITRPASIVYVALFVLFFAFGPVTLQGAASPASASCKSLLEMSDAGVIGLAAVVVFWQWLFERASLQVNNHVRQFEAKELSHCRLVCYRNRSLFGLGGETLACQVHMFFGFYPKEDWSRSSGGF